MGLSYSFSEEVSNSTLVLGSILAASSLYGVTTRVFKKSKTQDLTLSQVKNTKSEIFSTTSSTASGRSETPD